MYLASRTIACFVISLFFVFFGVHVVHNEVQREEMATILKGFM